MSLLARVAQRTANVSLTMPDFHLVARRAKSHVTSALLGYLDGPPPAALVDAADDGVPAINVGDPTALLRPSLAPGPLSFVLSRYAVAIVLIVSSLCPEHLAAAHIDSRRLSWSTASCTSCRRAVTFVRPPVQER
jgi:hypothetical protein